MNRSPGISSSSYSTNSDGRLNGVGGPRCEQARRSVRPREPQGIGSQIDRWLYEVAIRRYELGEPVRPGTRLVGEDDDGHPFRRRVPKDGPDTREGSLRGPTPCLEIRLGPQKDRYARWTDPRPGSRAVARRIQRIETITRGDSAGTVSRPWASGIQPAVTHPVLTPGGAGNRPLPTTKPLGASRRHVLPRKCAVSAAIRN